MAVLDLTGGRLDLAIRAGDDPSFRLPTPANFTGYSWAGQIRDNPGGTLLGAINITVDSTGAVCRISHTVTRALPLKSFYDIQVTALDAGAEVTTLLSGTIKTNPDVTV